MGLDYCLFSSGVFEITFDATGEPTGAIIKQYRDFTGDINAGDVVGRHVPSELWPGSDLGWIHWAARVLETGRGDRDSRLHWSAGGKCYDAICYPVEKHTVAFLWAESDSEQARKNRLIAAISFFLRKKGVRVLSAMLSLLRLEG